MIKHSDARCPAETEAFAIFELANSLASLNDRSIFQPFVHKTQNERAKYLGRHAYCWHILVNELVLEIAPRIEQWALLNSEEIIKAAVLPVNPQIKRMFKFSKDTFLDGERLIFAIRTANQKFCEFASAGFAGVLEDPVTSSIPDWQFLYDKLIEENDLNLLNNSQRPKAKRKKSNPAPKPSDERKRQDALVANLWKQFAMECKREGKRALRENAAKEWLKAQDDVEFLTDGLDDPADETQIAREIELAIKRHDSRLENK